MIKIGKGSSIRLAKDGNKLSKISLNLNWDTKKNIGKLDLDATCFGLIPSTVLESERELYSEEYFIFYHNTSTANGSVVHSGDDLSGATGETIKVDLDLIPNEIVELTFFITIDRAKKLGQNFSLVNSSSISIINDENGETLGQYQVENDSTFADKIAIQLGSLFRVGKEWEFKALGVASNYDLYTILKKYGVEAQE